MATSTSFSLLDERIQRWIWKQGWTSLLTIQENSIPIILKGESDVIVSAPTGGGKTEAVFLPIFSSLLKSPTSVGFSVLYVSPLKALINDQYRRLSEIGELLQITITPWHGDIPTEKKKKVLHSPSGVLMITPESLESMLMHYGDRISLFFSNLRYFVIDEIHSFVGRERGKQLQSLASRIELSARKTIPRIGLSATLSDYDGISSFIRPDYSLRCDIPSAGESQHELLVVLKEFKSSKSESPYQSIANYLFSSLRGSNNLIFVQSRATAENLCYLLKKLSDDCFVPNEFFVHHSSISKTDRVDVEQRLLNGDKPTSAVCTSTLELGIDIGAVKSVAQIGTCPSVSSLRQRLGRSGRRNEPSILRICNIDYLDLSLVFSGLRFNLMQNIASVELIREKKYEPFNTAIFDFSTLIQQLLSSLSQYGSFSAKEAWLLLCKKGAFRNINAELFLRFLSVLGAQSIISLTSSGQIVIGPKGESIVSTRDFYASFTSPKEIVVIENKTGRNIGTIDCLVEIGSNIILSGMIWNVVDHNDSRTAIFVNESEGGMIAPFSGTMLDVDRVVIAKMKDIYLSASKFPYLDSLAQEQMQLARATFLKLNLDTTDFITINDASSSGQRTTKPVFFTWAGARINRTISLVAKHILGKECYYDNCCVYDLYLDELKELFQIEDLNPVELAALVPRSYKIEGKYDYLLNDELLNIEFAHRRIDLAGFYALAL